MKIVDMDKDFLEVIDSIFTTLGYGGSAYEDLGFIFADWFMDALIKEHSQSKDNFMSLNNIEAIKPSAPYYGC